VSISFSFLLEVVHSAAICSDSIFCCHFLLPFFILFSRDVQAEAEMEVDVDGLFVLLMIFQNLRYYSTSKYLCSGDVCQLSFCSLLT
jgi:hypothetical protein